MSPLNHIDKLWPPQESVEVNTRAALARVRCRIAASRSHIPWYSRGVRPGALASSTMLQGILVAILMLAGNNRKTMPEIAHVVLLEPSVAHPVAVKPSHTNAGGGGQRSPLPVLRGELPKPAQRVFIPPLLTVEHPALTMDPSLIAPPDSWAAPTAAIGNPLGVIGGAGGPGRNGGIGGGDGPGIGDSSGRGAGNDERGVFTAGNGTTAPTVLTRVDPEYSEEARKAKYGGAVVLSIVVDTDGRARNIRVVRSVGMGLDEKAVEAVGQWRFRPGTNKGVPVKVRAQVEVTFRLL